MVDAAKLKDLITWMEAESGPSREMDFAIHALFFPGVKSIITYDPDLPHGFGKDPLSQALDPRPAYTASIDAALALVERVQPGCDWGIDKTDEGDPEEWFDAVVGEGFSQHRTAPLAILLALLRSIEGGDE